LNWLETQYLQNTGQSTHAKTRQKQKANYHLTGGGSSLVPNAMIIFNWYRIIALSSGESLPLRHKFFRPPLPAHKFFLGLSVIIL